MKFFRRIILWRKYFEGLKAKFEIFKRTTNIFNPIYNCKTTNKILYTLETIYGFSPSIDQEEMNIRGLEDESLFHNYSSNFRNDRNYIGTFVTSQYLRIKNWKFNSILKSKDESSHKFQEELRKEEIIKKLNETIQLLKDEEASSKTKESSTSSNSNQTNDNGKSKNYFDPINMHFSVVLICFSSVMLVLSLHFKNRIVGGLHKWKHRRNSKNGTCLQVFLLSWQGWR